MPRDTQIVRAATVAAPKDYTVDANVELLLHQVHAVFVDNGAAGEWLPCVDLISDSGHTIARCCDPNVKVAAGGSAEVSWFPGSVRTGAAAAGGTVPTGYAQRFGAFRFLPGQHGFNFGAGTLITNDSSVFSIDTVAHGIKAAHGGLFLTTIFMAFSTTAGVPFTGQFLLTTQCLDANGVSVQGLTQPEVDYSELYATAGGDNFNLNGFGLTNGDDTFYTPPYSFTYTVETDTDITAAACSFGVTILNPLGLT